MDTLSSIGLCLAVVLIIILLFFIYSGLLHKIDIQRIDSPYPAFTVRYKFSTGPFQNTGKLFEEVTKLAPDNKCFAIYYDEPGTVPDKDLRWAVGSILAEGDEQENEAVAKSLQEKGYKVKVLPKVNKVVKTWFPYKNRLSIFIAIYRVWNALGKDIKKTDCEANPWLEIYTRSEIHFVGILDHNDAYWVEEATKLGKERAKEYEQDQ